MASISVNPSFKTGEPVFQQSEETTTRMALKTNLGVFESLQRCSSSAGYKSRQSAFCPCVIYSQSVPPKTDEATGIISLCRSIVPFDTFKSMGTEAFL